MPVEFINHNELEKKLSEDKSTVVNIYADWCGPCKMLAPFLDEISKNTKVLKINADLNQDFLREKGIKGVPVTYIYKGKKLTKQFDGFVPKEAIEAEL